MRRTPKAGAVSSGSVNAKRGIPFFSLSLAVAEGPTMEDVVAFSADKLIQYTLGVAKPSSSSDVQEAFCRWAKTTGKGDVTIVQAKQVLGLKFFSKTGYTLKAVLGRAKTTVNVYLSNELPWTLKP